MSTPDRSAGDRKPPPEGAIRYAFSAVADALGLEESQAARAVRISGSTEQHYRQYGMSIDVAERMADRIGRHPYELWPEMQQHVLEEAERQERAAEEARLERRRAQKREQARRRRAREDARQREREYSARYYAELSPAAKRARIARQVEYKRENADRIRAQRAAAYRRRRDAEERSA